MSEILKVAVVGAGRMGSFVAGQLPNDVEKIIIDTNEATAKAVADACGGVCFTQMSGAKEADVIAIVLPAGVIPKIIDELASSAKEGAVIMNMATSGNIEDEIKAKYTHVTFVDSKIIGHADSMKEGAPCMVVVGTEDEAVYQKVAHILPGYTKVVMGDSNLVPQINTIGSTVGIRAAIEMRKELQPFNIPRDWEDVLIYTVCAGTMRAYVDNNLGHFGASLAEKLEKEMLGK